MFTMMPPGGSAARGEALAEMSVLQHQILTDKKVGDWLAAAAGEDLNDVEQANLREMTRHYQQATLLPESLVEAKSLAGSSVRARLAYAASRQRLAGFFRQPERGGQTQPRRGAPRPEAKGCTPYDALLDIFDPT
jgi:carboxypeptidase Taq